MQYDPIKRRLGEEFNRHPLLRILFYKLLDLLLLRTWHIRKEIRRWSKTHASPGEILDAGSGFGQYTYYLARKFRNSKILGVDLKEDQIVDCNRFFSQIRFTQVSFETSDLTKLQMLDRFDLVLCVDVMEHIEDDVSVFTNICHALKPGGLMLISTPSDLGGSDVHDHSQDSFIEEHVRDGYNRQEIHEKLKLAGFTSSQARYSYGKPGMISWRLSMKYPILMLGRSKLFFLVLPFYYLLTYPVSFLLNFLDVNLRHKAGTGLIVNAWK